MKMIKYACTLILALSVLNVQAQLTVTDNQSAAALANALVGEGVTISNPSLNCDGLANGLFEGISNLGIDSGIILTSGEASAIAGPVVGAGADDAGPFPYPPGDADLDNILDGITSTDACVLEFDFIPSGDTVRFNYVFGSTEYQGWSCSSFNDVFGFFISGPGYASPFNIATIPGTDIPICVNSTTGVPALNGTPPGTACTGMGAGSPFDEYYIDNMGGSTVNFGGFTTVFQAVAQTVPCETYHLKLAIGDGTDASLDSGVFLEAGSLSSPSIGGETESGQGVETPYSSTVRGCPPAHLIISRSGSTSVPLTVYFNKTGSAVPGVDYADFADSVVIPAGQSSASVAVQALSPGSGGTVQAVFEILSPYICGGTSGSVVDVDTITIFDSLHVNILQNDTTICLGASISLTVEGESYYSYQWTPAGTIDNPVGTNVTATPSVSTVYIVQGWIQGIVCPPATDQVVVNVEPGPELNLGPDLTLCTYDTAYIYAAVTPTSDNYTYTWTPGTFLNDSTGSYAIYHNDFPSGNDSIVVTATTAVGCKGVDTIRITVNAGEFLQNVVADTGVCPGTVFGYNIEGAEAYLWVPGNGLSDAAVGNPVVTPITSEDYMLYGYAKGCVDSAELHLEVHPAAQIRLADSVTIYPGESYRMDPQGNCLYYEWFPPSGLSASNIADPLATPEVRTRYFVKGTTEEGCEATDSIDVLVSTESLLDVPNAFTPAGGDFRIIRRGEAVLKVFAVYDRWGQKVFETTNIDEGWNGLFNNKPQPVGVYLYRVEAVTKAGTVFTKNGNVTLLR